MKIPKFLLIQFLILAVILGGEYFPIRANFSEKQHFFIALASIICAVVGALAYVISYQGLEKPAGAFMRFIMAGMVLRLFLSIIFLTLIAVTIKEVAFHFVLAYFLSFLIFTPFEVFGLMSKLRPHLKK